MAGIKVLLVDDEEELVSTLAQRLGKRGFVVSGVLNGEKALEKLGTDEHDVVILDVFMPGMSGIDTLKQIKSRHPLAEVIMLSGHATLELAIEGMQYGAFDFLVKPADMGALVEKINKAYGRKVEHQERIRNARFVQDKTTAGTDRRKNANGAPRPAELPSDKGRLLVLGSESDFSRQLMQYSLDLAKRMGYALLAMNAAGFDAESFKQFPAAREQVCQDFRDISVKNAVLFGELAEKAGVPFAHVVKCFGQDDAVAQIVGEVGPVDYVVSESDEGPNKGQIVAYCPM